MKKRILCFGDSNTWGYCGADKSRYDEDVRWTGRLQAMLGDGYTVIEEGQNGRTTVRDDFYENRLAGLTYLWPCMESHHPFDLLIVMLGTNDAKYYFNARAKSIAEGAGRLVDMAQKSDFGRDRQPPKVLLIAPVRIENNESCAHVFGEQAAEKSREFPQEFRAVAEQYGCEFMDASEFAGPCAEDGVHISRDGHGRLARAMCDKIKQMLG